MAVAIAFNEPNKIDKYLRSSKVGEVDLSKKWW